MSGITTLRSGDLAGIKMTPAQEECRIDIFGQLQFAVIQRQRKLAVGFCQRVIRQCVHGIGKFPGNVTVREAYIPPNLSQRNA